MERYSKTKQVIQMTPVLEMIADELVISAQELERRSLLAFIEREHRLTQMDVADLQDRYGVQQASELASKIENRQIYSHPAWEELIEWEQLEGYGMRLAHWQRELVAANV
jgi:predicted nuclease of restriction endonuclease-like RecB superfamily